MKRIKLDAATVKKFIPPRNYNSRKGDNGTVLVVGGSYIYHGAPALASLAALRSGTDLVYVAVPNTHVAPLRAMSPDLIIIPTADPKLTRGSANKLLGVVPKDLDSAAIGMGLAVNELHALKMLVSQLVDSDARLVLDAAALVPGILPAISNKNVIVTPHAGEFRRLFGSAPPDDADRRTALVERTASEHGIIILLKGPTDIITDGNVTYLNHTRTSAMTVGGSGDVLSGLAAGLVARNRNTLESAAAAAFINGRAGMAVQERLGLHMIPSDLINAIPGIMKPFDGVLE